jgi:hypothetical protein
MGVLFRLAIVSLSVGLADSLSPETVGPALFLATGPRRIWRVTQFTLGVFVVYFVVGVVLLTGPGRWLIGLVPNPQGTARHVIEIVVGVVLLVCGVALWLGRRQAGLDLALGVIPFAGTLAATYLWTRHRTRPDVNAFAALALALTSLLVVLVSFTAYQQTAGGDEPRIHERYLIYVLPLFIIAMVATTTFARSRRMLGIGLLAGVIAGVLPVTIPYHSMMNGTVGADTFGLTVFVRRAPDGGVMALQSAAVVAVTYALCLGVIYALLRPNTVLLVAATAGILVFIGFKVQTLLDVGASAATAHTLPATRNWVDAAGPTGRVVVLENARRQHKLDLANAETAFFNLSISRLYYVCTPLLLEQYGEIKARVDRRGVVLDGSGPLRARYLVAPRGTGIVGRVVASDIPGGLVLLRPERGVVRIVPAARAGWRCPAKSS